MRFLQLLLTLFLLTHAAPIKETKYTELTTQTLTATEIIVENEATIQKLETPELNANTITAQQIKTTDLTVQQTLEANNDVLVKGDLIVSDVINVQGDVILGDTTIDVLHKQINDLRDMVGYLMEKSEGFVFGLY